jgi:RimJ/RimL family protein N-acetyltransferase
LRPASTEDIEEVLQKSKTQSSESAHELIQRKWFYESGFHDYYVARTSDANQLCHIAWLLSPEDDTVVRHGFRYRLPGLKESEVLVENLFTFESYRGKGIMSSAMVKLGELARTKGFKRMITYVSHDNIASLKACERAGFKKFEEIPELKLLFFTIRKHGQD